MRNYCNFLALVPRDRICAIGPDCDGGLVNPEQQVDVGYLSNVNLNVL